MPSPRRSLRRPRRSLRRKARCAAPSSAAWIRWRPTTGMANSDQDGGQPAGKVARAVMRLSPRDNVAVALRALKSGETVTLDGVPIAIRGNIAVGHKLAAQPI